ncbi:MAG: threonine/serine exporter family protein [Actinomycetia bacterium]|nr:threonine/serine exporter family protein [Actinomycetes bacterium]
MTDERQKLIVKLATTAGELMMRSGSEVYRVEQTVTRICQACGVPNAECFATPTGIFVSVDGGSTSNQIVTSLKRISSSAIDLKRISELHTFSRDFTNTTLGLGAAGERLENIAAKPNTYRFPIRLLGAVLVGLFICPYFGADLKGMCFAGLASAVGYTVSLGCQRLQLARFVQILISCAFCTLTALLFLKLFPGEYVRSVIVGAVTVFMPGVALVNSARDILSGDMITGMARATDGVITALAIAGGSATIMSVWQSFEPTFSMSPTVYPWPLFFVFGACLTLGFSLIFHAPVRKLAFVSVIGGTGMLVFILISQLTGNSALATFIGASCIATLAEVASRAGREVTTIYIIPGIIPLVPGVMIFESMSALLTSGVSAAADKATEALICASCIALALVLTASVARLTVATLNRLKTPNPS